jgi:hypothetical protein
LTAAVASKSWVIVAASFLLDFVAAAHQPLRHIGVHSTQADHSEVHGVSFAVKLRPQYCATKASALPIQKCRWRHG